MNRLRSLWLDLTVAQKGIIVAALPVITLLLAAIPIVVNEVNAGRDAQANAVTLAIRASTRDIKVNMQEAESRILGFVITRDSTELLQFDRMLRSSKMALNALDTLIRGDTTARSIHSNVKARINIMQTELMSELDRISRRGVAREDFMLALSQARRNMLSLRTLIDQLIETQESAITMQVARLDRNRRNRNVLAAFVVVVGLGATILSAMLFVSGIASRVDLLQDNATRPRRDRKTVHISGEDELGQLALVIEENRRDAARIADRLRVAIRAARIEVIEMRPDQDELSLIGSGNVFRRMGFPVGAIPRTLSEFILNVHEDDRARVAHALSNPTPGAEYEVEFRMRGSDHDWHWMDLRGAAAAAPDSASAEMALTDEHPAAVGVLLEVTERKVAEEQVKNALTAADAANRAKSDFVSRMSHELRTPLNAVLGFAQLLEIDDLTPDQRESVSHILRGGRYLLDLINEVLDLARIEAGRFAMSIEAVSMREVVGAVVALIGPQAAEFGVRLYFPPPGFNVYSKADRHRLKQVLLNLLSNAIKYNRRGGSVEVGLEKTETTVRVLVKDTGPGMTTAELDRLFLPFERLEAAKSGVEGTGLGLALSRSIVEAMGGTITVDSTPGSGSTFTVLLPRAEAPDDEFEAATLEMPVAQMTIVYVEDNQANVRLVERVVERRPGMRLVTIGEGDRAHDLVRKENPNLVLLDVNLPGLSGDAVLEQIRNDPSTAAIPVAILSADATPAQIERLRSLGAQHYFTKPIDGSRLLQLFDDVAAGRQNDEV